MKSMHKIAGSVTVAVVLATFGIAAGQPAPQTGFRRIPVQQADLTVPGREVSRPSPRSSRARSRDGIPIPEKKWDTCSRARSRSRCRASPR